MNFRDLKKYSKDYSINNIIVILFVPIIFSLFLPLTGDYKFVIHALFVLLIIVNSKYFKLDKEVCDQSFMMAVTFLAFISVTSILKNGLATSIHGLAQYASYIMLYIAIKNYTYKKEHISFMTKVLGWTFVFNLLYVIIGSQIIEDQNPGSWGEFFYNNQNQTLVTLLCLFPFFILSPIRNYLKLTLTCLFVLLIFISNSSGTKLMFLSICIFYLFSFKKWIRPMYLMIFFIGIFFISLISDKKRKNEIVHSTKVMMINPVLGFGINTWDEAYNNREISNLTYSSEHTFRKRELQRNISHNKYLNVLVEFGIIGFFLFFFPFFYNTFSFIDNNLLMPYYLTIFIFLLACVIYSFPISDSRYFSSLYYCAIISLSTITNRA